MPQLLDTEDLSQQTGKTSKEDCMSTLIIDVGISLSGNPEIA